MTILSSNPETPVSTTIHLTHAAGDQVVSSAPVSATCYIDYSHPMQNDERMIIVSVVVKQTDFFKATSQLALGVDSDSLDAIRGMNASLFLSIIPCENCAKDVAVSNAQPEDADWSSRKFKGNSVRLPYSREFLTCHCEAAEQHASRSQ
ncbi:hypothetical protein CCP3SC15_1210003 [Gammaproteobacteria bacterium]